MMQQRIADVPLFVLGSCELGDDAPILGPAPLDGLVYATGHHRNAILLTPVTADAIARLVLDGVAEPSIRPFSIERFAAPARTAAE